MKKIVLVIFSLVVGLSAWSQKDTVYLKRESKQRIITDRAPQVVFAELGGPGIALSANYDRRFSKETAGLGYRVGIGYSFSNDFKFTTIPLGINYLMGEKYKGRFFEVGINGTMIIVNRDLYYGDGIFTIDDVDNGKKTLWMTSVLLGYRSQPVRGGFNFRGGIMPVFIDGETGIGGYLSFGYNF